MDLSTRYLGFDLPNPLIVGASPLGDKMDRIRELEDAGAAALTLRSLFEEQIEHEQAAVQRHVLAHEEAFAEALSYFPGIDETIAGPDEYLEHLREVKESVSIPVIASLNGTHQGVWVQYAQYLEEAGADAIEFNLYFLPSDPHESGLMIEERCLSMVHKLRETTRLPIAVKISPYFTSIPHIARELADVGADALVLFNRLYQPDIDPELQEYRNHLRLSTPDELHLRLRWLAAVHGRVSVDLAVTGGVHTERDVVKSMMAGADACQMVSALLKHGPRHIEQVLKGLENWLEEYEFDSLDQLQGSLDILRCPNPETLERANYIRILQTWQA